MGNEDDSGTSSALPQTLPPTSTSPPSRENVKSRIDQLSNHLAPSNNASTSVPPPRPGPKRSSPVRRSAPLPPDWSDVLSEINKVRALGETPNISSTGYKRHKEAGKLWVRERIELLCDPGTFREVGGLAGAVSWKYPDVKKDSEGFVLETNLKTGRERRVKRSPEEEERQVVDKFVPSNNVQGFAKIRGRKIILTADDFTIRAGHADGALMPKTIYMDKMSVHLRIPKVNVVDGASGGGSLTTYKKEGGSYLPKLELLYWLVKQLDLGIPQCSAVVGPAVGLGAARAAVSHFSVIAADIGSLFNAGPKIVEGATFEEDLRYVPTLFDANFG